MEGSGSDKSNSLETTVRLRPKEFEARRVKLSEAKVMAPYVYDSLESAIFGEGTFSLLQEGVMVRTEHLREWKYSNIGHSFSFNKTDVENAKQWAREEGYNPSSMDIAKMELSSIKNLERAVISQIGENSEHHIKDQLQKFQIERSGSDELDQNYLENMCNLMGVGVDDYISNMTFSYWELIPGLKGNVIKDSSVKGRYHVLSQEKPGDNNLAYSVVDTDDGSMEIAYSNTNQGDLSVLKRKVNLYKEVENVLGAHSKSGGIELSTFDGIDYFLQWHFMREFEEANFEIGTQKGAVNVPYVRGGNSERRAGNRSNHPASERSSQAVTKRVNL